jgi:glyoxylase-like metal-dependent hydrolase (beta-lactamase superfamily II)
MTGAIDYPGGISAIDTDHVRPWLDASHLIVERGRAAFVDTGTSHGVPRLLAALTRAGISPDAVDYIFVTHAHLDHAGGAGLLVQQLPNARVVVHPRAAPHLAEPGKLIAATRQVYGASYDRLYGHIPPIPRARLLETEEGARYSLAGRSFECLHTPGHALHHYVLIDHAAQAVFAGDTFGVSYREFDLDGREFVFPATTPSHFDPDQLRHSVARIVASGAQFVFLTHFGRVGHVSELAESLYTGIRAYVAMALARAGHAEREQALRADMYQWMSERLDAHGDSKDARTRHQLLDGDIALNVAGLMAWLERRARSA